MQIKKNKIENKLLKSAKEEFLKNGFEKASVRTIVKNAETTIGNFYNYFDSKENIFCALVGKTYDKISSFIENHNAKDENPFALNSLNSKMVRKLVSGALGLLTQSFIENLILLVDCSEGTRYSTAKSDITNFIHKHFLEHAEILSPDYEDKGIGLLLSQQFVEGTLSVIRQDTSVNKKSELLVEYLLFYTYGMMNILNIDVNK